MREVEKLDIIKQSLYREVQSMKMIVYSCAKEEAPLFRHFAGAFGAQLTLLPEKPTLQNACLTQGMDAVNILSATLITP